MEYPSLTHKWISENWTSVHPKLHKYISKKVAIDADMVDAYLSNAVEYILRNKNLDPYLKEGKEISFYYLARICWSKAQRQHYKWGKDAHMKALYDCKTATDSKRSCPQITANSQAHSHPSSNDDHYNDFNGRLSDCPHTSYYLKETLEILKHRLSDWKSREDSNYFWDVFQMNLLGYTTHDISSDYKVSVSKVKSDRRKIRSLVSGIF